MLVNFKEQNGTGKYTFFFGTDMAYEIYLSLQFAGPK